MGHWDYNLKTIMNYKQIKFKEYLNREFEEHKKWRTAEKKEKSKCKKLKTLMQIGIVYIVLFLWLCIYNYNKVEDMKIDMIPQAGASEFVSIKEYLGLDGCRNIQLEEDHIHNGWMYAFDVACIRGQSFDVKAPTWKDVYEVRVVWYDSRMGNYIVLKHGEYWFVFGHTETLLKKWDRVKGGDLIWKVDKSWITQNYHLHFEIWKHDYNISYKVMYWEEPVYNMEKTYALRKQRGWYIWEEEVMDFIADFEGFRECAYDDWKQVSIWYGTKSYFGECISKQEGKKRKMEEVERLMENIYKNHFVKYHNQRQALVSATYNLGINSSISRVKYRKTEDGICEYFGAFVKANWEVLWWLVKRRDTECDVYIGKQKI